MPCAPSPNAEQFYYIYTFSQLYKECRAKFSNYCICNCIFFKISSKVFGKDDIPLHANSHFLEIDFVIFIHFCNFHPFLQFYPQSWAVSHFMKFLLRREKLLRCGSSLHLITYDTSWCCRMNCICICLFIYLCICICLFVYLYLFIFFCTIGNY